jgi:hypothetical protein
MNLFREALQPLPKHTLIASLFSLTEPVGCNTYTPFFLNGGYEVPHKLILVKH